MSLRARLLLALVGLLTVGLTLGAVGTHFALESYLSGRLDEQVREAHPILENNLQQWGGVSPGSSDQHTSSSTGPGSGGLGDDRMPRFGSGFVVGTYGALYDTAGKLIAETAPGLTGSNSPTERPSITPAVLAGAVVRPDLATVPLTTVPAQGNSHDRFRMFAERYDQGPLSGDVFVVAVPYSEMDATLHRADVIELIASAVTMAALALLAYALIRIGLHPLTRIEQTADEIAWGDLTRRVADTNGRTEVGRLGLAFNAMLTKIEAAFRAQEASEQRLRRFVADASHELRTPLTSIRGYAEMFHRGAASRPEDLALVMRRIEDESTRMSGLVDDLLLLARLDQGPTSEPHPVDVAALARDIANDARAVAPERRIESVVPPFLEITGDENRLRQAVGNLVRNALVHTPPESPVTVSVEVTPAPRESLALVSAVSDTGPLLVGAGLRHGARHGARHARRAGMAARGIGPSVTLGEAATLAEQVVISVVDHGRGIPPDAVPYVFDRFYRADPGRSRDAGGSGLGLSIVAAVATAHGGHVEYDPTPGGGATFRLVLPRR
jgi:two-component system OmpR family sensor kinase